VFAHMIARGLQGKKISGTDSVRLSELFYPLSRLINRSTHYYSGEKTMQSIFKTKLITACALALFSVAGFSASPYSPVGGPATFQSVPIKCTNGFQKTKSIKAPNGMVTKMVCKSPVISCPENTAPGINQVTEPKIVNVSGTGDDVAQFRFVYTCRYYKPAG
jgi:hypothetical protein